MRSDTVSFDSRKKDTDIDCKSSARRYPTHIDGDVRATRNERRHLARDSINYKNNFEILLEFTKMGLLLYPPSVGRGSRGRRERELVLTLGDPGLHLALTESMKVYLQIQISH